MAHLTIPPSCGVSPFTEGRHQTARRTRTEEPKSVFPLYLSVPSRKMGPVMVFDLGQAAFQP